jgi:hypothetical protein
MARGYIAPPGLLLFRSYGAMDYFFCYYYFAPTELRFFCFLLLLCRSYGALRKGLRSDKNIVIYRVNFFIIFMKN